MTNCMFRGLNGFVALEVNVVWPKSLHAIGIGSESGIIAS